MTRHTPGLYSQIIQEAAEWFVELEAEGAELEKRQAFDEWLRRSPEHVRAFLELLPIWEGAAATRPMEADPHALIALQLRSRSNVVALEGLRRGDPEHDAPSQPMGADHAHRVHSRHRPDVAGMAAAVAGLVVVGLLAWWLIGAPSSYSTRLAEQRFILLKDGSSVELNTHSRITVRFTDHERLVDLLEGQALFHVAKDAARPFIVRSDAIRVRAVGTQFDVYRQRGRTIVTVLEGRVAVLPRAADASPVPGTASERDTAAAVLPDPLAPPPSRSGSQSIFEPEPAAAVYSVLISAGEQSVSTATTIGQPTRANVDAATSWVYGRMLFQKAPLGEVVEQFNRYNSRQIRIDDARIDAFLVSGTFSSTDPQSLLRFLRSQPGIRVIDRDEVIRITATDRTGSP